MLHVISPSVLLYLSCSLGFSLCITGLFWKADGRISGWFRQRSWGQKSEKKEVLGTAREKCSLKIMSSADHGWSNTVMTRM